MEWINIVREKINLDRNEIVLRENNNSQSQINIVVREKFNFNRKKMMLLNKELQKIICDYEKPQGLE